MLPNISIFSFKKIFLLVSKSLDLLLRKLPFLEKVLLLGFFIFYEIKKVLNVNIQFFQQCSTEMENTKGCMQIHKTNQGMKIRYDYALAKFRFLFFLLHLSFYLFSLFIFMTTTKYFENFKSLLHFFGGIIVNICMFFED